MSEPFECTAFHHRPSRRERFARWRERLRERIWRRLHPTQARAQDEARAAAWRRVAPALKVGAGSLFAPRADLLAAYRDAPLPNFGMDFAWEPPEPAPMPWYRRLRWRVSGWIWRIIEAL